MEIVCPPNFGDKTIITMSRISTLISWDDQIGVFIIKQEIERGAHSCTVYHSV